MIYFYVVFLLSLLSPFFYLYLYLLISLVLISFILGDSSFFSSVSGTVPIVSFLFQSRKRIFCLLLKTRSISSFDLNVCD